MPLSSFAMPGRRNRDPVMNAPAGSSGAQAGAAAAPPAFDPFAQQSGEQKANLISSVGSGASVYPQILGAMGRPAARQGLFNLTEILQGQGKTDPRLMNMMRTNIMRGTSAQQEAAGARAAGKGMSRSGVASAIDAAIGQGGAQQLAGVDAQEAQMQEQRKRQDLQLLMDLIIGPSMGLTGQNLDFEMSNRMAEAQERAAKYQAMGAAVGGLTSAIPMCWVARAVYGEDDPRWKLVRHYMLTEASDELRGAYWTHGPELAEIVKTSPYLKSILRPAFDHMISA